MTPQKPAETPWTTWAAIAVLVAVIVLGALFLGQDAILGDVFRVG
jgi:hypothetical protein